MKYNDSGNFMQDDTKTTSRPRGRPRSYEHGTALKQVADAFRDRGYSATSLDDVARATGLNRPSLYLAFGDKKAMYLASLVALRAELRQIPGRLVTKEMSLEEILRRLLSGSIEGYLAGPAGPRGCLAVCTASAEAVADADIRASLAETLDVIDAMVTELFKRAGMPAAQARRQARLVSAVLHSLSVRARAGQPRVLLEEVARDALKLLVPSKH